MKERRRPEIPLGGIPGESGSTPAIHLVAQQLNVAYQDLQTQIENLNRQLAQTNLELRQSLAEKDRMCCYLKSILESLDQGVIAVDLSSRVVAFNRAAEEILGKTAEGVMGKAYDEIWIQRTDEEFSLPAILKTGETHKAGEKDIEAKKGEKIPLSFSQTLLKDAQGESFGAVEVFSKRDDPESADDEMTRMKTLAALGEMTAVVAHEIKNPLGGIRGFAELLDRDLKQGDPRKKSVQKIIQGVEALNKIVGSLLAQSRPIKLNLRRVEMAGFTEEAISFFQMDSSNQKPDVRLVKVFPREKLHCNLDTEQFRQAVLNLLRNAVQAMPQGGEIKVQLSRMAEDAGFRIKVDEQMVVLSISDTGMGMSRQVQEKAFAPFFTTKEGGTGLGLFTVKKTVEAHGGQIRLESQPGKGTTVKLGLPIAG
jgi:PAS domain S-box-containing protein